MIVSHSSRDEREGPSQLLVGFAPSAGGLQHPADDEAPQECSCQRSGVLKVSLDLLNGGMGLSHCALGLFYPPFPCPNDGRDRDRSRDRGGGR